MCVSPTSKMEPRQQIVIYTTVAIGLKEVEDDWRCAHWRFPFHPLCGHHHPPILGERGRVKPRLTNTTLWKRLETGKLFRGSRLALSITCTSTCAQMLLLLLLLLGGFYNLLFLFQSRRSLSKGP